MKIQYMTCARSSAVDRATNELSLFHILDEIGAPAFPLRMPSFCVAALFEREPDDDVVQHYVMSVTLDGKLLASFTMQVDFARSRRNRNVNTLKSLVIPAPGRLRLSLMQRENELAHWDTVAIQTGAAVQPAASPLPNEVRTDPSKTGPTIN